ncbi:MAG TPA: DUF2905 domain-containing protein, partial [Chitinophagales bacterium]|nr:DUF2905 domain-containing protein [Chitinophagales bacterium]
KILIICGAVLIVIGVLLSLFGKINGIPRLPGDIVIRRDGFTFYFPIVTSIILSILLTLIIVAVKKLR